MESQGEVVVDGSVGWACQRQCLRLSSSSSMMRLCSSSPTTSPASKRGTGFITMVPSWALISRIVPSSMPSFVLSSMGMVTWPFRLTRTLDNFSPSLLFIQSYLSCFLLGTVSCFIQGRFLWWRRLQLNRKPINKPANNQFRNRKMRKYRQIQSQLSARVESIYKGAIVCREQQSVIIHYSL